MTSSSAIRKGCASALFCFLLAASLNASAQTRIVGVLLPNQPPPEFPAFAQQLAKLGWEEGRNLRIMVRHAGGAFERLPALAKELVDANPAVLVSVFTPPTKAAMQATTTIPIVGFFGVPLELGVVDNVARPGRHLTGVTNRCGEIAGKRLSLLTEAVPKARRIAVLLNVNDPVTQPQVEELQRIVPKTGLEVRFYRLKSPDDLPAAFEDAMKWPAQAGMWLCGQGAPFVKRTVELSFKHRLPVMVNQRQDVEAGGLLSYFPDHHERFRTMAVYVDRILKGAKPADLPVDQPLQFELVINLKTARELGIGIPASLLSRADVVIN
jgi:putative ABC transport system substrate-binding protein